MVQKFVRRLQAKKEIEKAKRAALEALKSEKEKRWENVLLCLEKTADKLKKEGWAYKKGGRMGGRRNWKKRFFVLYKDTFSYYTDLAEEAKLEVVECMQRPFDSALPSLLVDLAVDCKTAYTWFEAK